MKQVFLFLLFMFCILGLSAQEDSIRLRRDNYPKLSFPDSLRIDANNLLVKPVKPTMKELHHDVFCWTNKKIAFDFDQPQRKTIFNSSYSRLIIPTVLISYGVTTQFIRSFKDLDTSTGHEVGEHISDKNTFDNYLQFAPLAGIYGLDLIGIKAKHNLRDRTLIVGTSYLLMGGTVKALKSIINIERPDGSAQNSFPSGHTATAFVGAHILFKEYKETSLWIGVAGYAAAATTGAMRIVNQKHWISDVVTGAGVGILSAEIGYMLLPVWHKALGVKEKSKTLVIVPTINAENVGIGMSYTF